MFLLHINFKLRESPCQYFSPSKWHITLEIDQSLQSDAIFLLSGLCSIQIPFLFVYMLPTVV